MELKLAGTELIYKYIFASLIRTNARMNETEWQAKWALNEDLLPCFQEVKFLGTF